MYRIYHNNDSHVCLTYERNKKDLYNVDLDFYDSEGYYVAHKSKTRFDLKLDFIESEIQAAQDLVKEGLIKKVERYS